MSGEGANVSVVIPAHNAAKTLRATLESIHNQTIQPREVIVAADNCSDDTAQIARNFGATVIELSTGNGSSARNRAAELATGEYIFLLDSDDLWHPQKIEAHLANWNSHPNSGFMIDPSQRVRIDGNKRGYNGGGPAGPLTWQSMVEQRNWSSGSAISVRRSDWEKVKGFNESLPGMQDVEFLIRIAHEVGPGYRISKSLTTYFLHETGVSRRVPWGDGIIALLKVALPFMTEAEWNSLHRTIALRNALGSRFPEAFRHFAAAGWPVGDPRLWKYFLLCASNTIRKR